MEYKKLDEIIEFNPKENIAKKQLAKKISMDNLDCFTKYIKTYSLEEYNGGMKFRNGDTLLARITPCLENGKTSKVTILDENETGFGSTEYIVMRSKRDISDEDFIFYLAISPMFRDIAIKSMTGTSGRQRVQLDVVKNTEMLVPSYQEQVKIGKILSNIDKKIELNNKINDNLYEISKQLYKRWFIDYEFPNESGKPYKSSGGKMIDSEIGEIPENWKVKQLDELVNVINGYSYKGKELVEESNVGMATIKNFDRTGGFKLDGYKPLNPEKIKEQQIVELFDLVVAHTDLTQNADIIGNPILILNKKNYEKIVISMDLVKVDPKDEKFNKFFIFETLNSDRFKNHALGYVSGTTVLHLGKSCIKQYAIAIPETDDKVKDISQTIKANYEKISEFITENQVLEQLRNTLLPKLMNGEIDLENIKI